MDIKSTFRVAAVSLCLIRGDMAMADELPTVSQIQGSQVRGINDFFVSDLYAIQKGALELPANSHKNGRLGVRSFQRFMGNMSGWSTANDYLMVMEAVSQGKETLGQPDANNHHTNPMIAGQVDLSPGFSFRSILNIPEWVMYNPSPVTVNPEFVDLMKKLKLDKYDPEKWEQFATGFDNKYGDPKELRSKYSDLSAQSKNGKLVEAMLEGFATVANPTDPVAGMDTVKKYLAATYNGKKKENFLDGVPEASPLREQLKSHELAPQNKEKKEDALHQGVGAVNPDGTVTIVKPDGQVLTKDNNGNVLQENDPTTKKHLVPNFMPKLNN